MRIISGRLGGRTFQSPRTYHTHPMSDKIRGALFNMLGDIRGLTVLDAFAGSGAIGFEAVSRGAKSAELIELDKDAFKTIKQNIDSLDLSESVHAVLGNIRGWSNRHTHQFYDIVVCDPPYDAILEKQIHQIARHVIYGGLLVVSWPEKESIPVIPGLEMLRHKTYGNATLVIYQKTK